MSLHERDWHYVHDPDGEGDLCYAVTEDVAARQETAGVPTHRADDCPRRQGGAS